MGALCLSSLEYVTRRDIILSQRNRPAIRTSTRPPHPLHSAPCPYRTGEAVPYHSPIRSSRFIRRGRLLPNLIANVHQGKGRCSAPHQYVIGWSCRTISTSCARGWLLTKSHSRPSWYHSRRLLPLAVCVTKTGVFPM